jgi:hypothetical protein
VMDCWDNYGITGPNYAEVWCHDAAGGTNAAAPSHVSTKVPIQSLQSVASGAVSKPQQPECL